MEACSLWATITNIYLLLEKSPSHSVQKLFPLPVTGFQSAILNSGSRHLRRPCSMSKRIMSRHSRTLIHDVGLLAYNLFVKNSAACIDTIELGQFFALLHVCFNSISVPITWYEIKKWRQLVYVENWIALECIGLISKSLTRLIN